MSLRGKCHKRWHALALIYILEPNRKCRYFYINLDFRGNIPFEHIYLKVGPRGVGGGDNVTKMGMLNFILILEGRILS